MATEQHISTSAELSRLIREALALAQSRQHQFLTPEHLLRIIADLPQFAYAVSDLPDEEVDRFHVELEQSVDDMETVPDDIWAKIPVRHGMPKIEASLALNAVYKMAAEQAVSSGRDRVEVAHVMSSMFDAPDCMALYLLHSLVESRGEFMSRFVNYTPGQRIADSSDPRQSAEDDRPRERAGERKRKSGKHDWRGEVTCINDIVESHNPLIGRERELERTVQVLCRRDKNNPLHIGEPGVGKTAIVYGLARMINAGEVPGKLRGAKIYRLEMGSLVAGTAYRGDFEQKLRDILEGASEEGNSIIYIDEIHTVMGAGATREGGLDASNILKRYLEEGSVRFIGATTFEEFKTSVERNKALSRRFQEIEICEPSVEEAVEILDQLRPHYEEFHGVSYAAGVMEYAVRMSARHLSGRFLPDKAIDLIDEAGAFRQIHPSADGSAVVDNELVAEVLSKVAKVNALAMKEETIEQTGSLGERVLGNVYGQDAAVKDVVESVLMARAGLTEEGHTLGAFLFVGPTGVGKTELARILAREMGIGLVRFDMSEYAEKHTVAKLIGSPAGYVGYEDGGLLTDAIRKQPSCVLLLDEIEKAHPDIYNILLQVMDYARLTDNRGRQADFSNVVVVMTSNAGAQFASQASVGFGSKVSSGSAMMKEVKRVFKPEFLNRLTAVEIFNDMDDTMASMILDKALRGLKERLSVKNVDLGLSDSARGLLLKRGLTREYGARQLHRVIEQLLSRPLSREILFGRLKGGGRVMADADTTEEITFNFE